MPPSPAELAAQRQAAQQQLAKLASDVAGEAWAAVDPANIALSWTAQLQRLLVALTGAQTIAAASADGYVDSVLDAQGVEVASAGVVQAARLAGVASDGRPLDSLLYQPAVQVLQLIGQGVGVQDALRAGRVSLDMIVRTQVADAGRAATGVGIAARGVGYVRQLNPPSCSRCVILAGRFYRWNAGFRRHPRCDCVHVPTTAGRGKDLTTSPRGYFDSLSPREQDRVFTQAGADAIRNGADMGQVVNARRGMQTAGESRTTVNAQGLVVNARRRTRVGTTTTESTTRRGVARKGRLMPEEIYRQAGGQREEALRLLELNGYIVRRPALNIAPRPGPAIRPVKAPAKAAVPVPAPRPAPGAPAPPPPPTVPPRPVMPVPGGASPFHRNLDGIEDLADAVEHGFPVQSRRVLTGGVSAETELLVLKGGTKVVHKYGGNPEAEHAASMIGRALGLRVPRVYRNRLSAVYMDFVDDALPADVLALRGGFTERRAAAFNSDDGKLIGLFDDMIANADRNAGNWMLTDTGRVVPIDHGHAFNSAVIGQEGRRIRPRTSGSPFSEHYRTDLTQADVQELRRRLELIRPDFVHIGRERWLDYALAVLADVEPHARGVRNLVR